MINKIGKWIYNQLSTIEYSIFKKKYPSFMLGYIGGTFIALALIQIWILCV